MPLVILTADEMNGFYSEFEEEILAEDGEVEEVEIDRNVYNNLSK